MKQDKIVVLAEIIVLLVVFVIVPALWLGGWSVGGAMEVAVDAISTLGFCAVVCVGFAVALDLYHRISGMRWWKWLRWKWQWLECWCQVRVSSRKNGR